MRKNEAKWCYANANTGDLVNNFKMLFAFIIFFKDFNEFTLFSTCIVSSNLIVESMSAPYMLNL